MTAERPGGLPAVVFSEQVNGLMKIVELLDAQAIVADMHAAGKAEALEELAATMTGLHPRLNRGELMQVLQERERLGSTGIGDGIAIPHGKLRDLDRLMICFGRHRQGVDFDAMDGRPTQLFFLLVAPEDAAGVHLKALARISKLLRNEEVRSRLLAAADAEALYRIIAEEDEKL